MTPIGPFGSRRR